LGIGGAMTDLVSSKYTFVCDPDECDCLIELTSSDGFGFPSGVMELTCPCGRKTTLLSVEHATLNTPTKEREQMLDNLEATIDLGSEYNPNQLVTYKKIHGYSDPEIVTEKVTSLEWDLHNGRQASKHNAVLQDKINNVRDYIGERFADSDDQEALTEIAEFLDISLTKTVTISATIQVDVEVELPLDEVNDFDAHYFLQDELCIDSNNGNVSIDSWTVENTDVDWN
jgi:hypothetical protein